ncbi:MAG: hypothetical protein ACXVBX_09060 [Flavisolibacter sp.]
MKLLLFFALSFIGAGTFAQVPNQENPRAVPPPDSVRNYKGNSEKQFRKEFEEYFERKKMQSQLFGDRQGNIARLPQDHMPCVVPDSASAGLVPNAWGGVTVPFRPNYHPIPNPVLPPESFKYNTLDNSALAPSR